MLKARFENASVIERGPWWHVLKRQLSDRMTPFDWASLSLNGSELPPPTVGGSPLTSGGQVAPLSGGGVAVDCASDTFVVTTVTNAAMIGTTERKGNSFRVCRAC